VTAEKKMTRTLRTGKGDLNQGAKREGGDVFGIKKKRIGCGAKRKGHSIKGKRGYEKGGLVLLDKFKTGAFSG